MRYLLSIFFILLVSVLSCTKENKFIHPSGRYKMVVSYIEFPTDSGISTVISTERLISNYLEFVDSNTVLISDTIGFPGMVPSISSGYSIENNTVYIDSALLSPFSILVSGSTFIIESQINASGVKNKFSK